VAQDPTPAGLAKARAAAERVAKRFGVRFASRAEVESWQRDTGRTLYLLDVRTREEFEQRRIAGSRHAPGGQLVQATDEYIGVRNARVVLIDPARVRSVMTASWLVQMGWDEVFVLEPEGDDGFSGWRTEHGRVRDRSPASRRGKRSHTGKSDRDRFFDEPALPRVSRSGRWWAVRSRLAEARARIGAVTDLVLTSEDGVLAHLAAREAAALWPGTRVRVLDGGNAQWRASEALENPASSARRLRSMTSGTSRTTTVQTPKSTRATTSSGKSRS
jgi:rhodanese-related sulfurtransferase